MKRTNIKALGTLNVFGSGFCSCLAGSHVLDEAERSLHDALCVLQQTVNDSRVVFGGGAPEMQMAKVPPC